SALTIRTAAVSSRVDDFAGCNAGYVAAGFGIRSGVRAAATDGYCGDWWIDDGVAVVVDRHAVGLCNFSARTAPARLALEMRSVPGAVATGWRYQGLLPRRYRRRY